MVAALPALLLGAFLSRGVERVFHGNASALFYFGDAWRGAGALPENAIVEVESPAAPSGLSNILWNGEAFSVLYEDLKENGEIVVGIDR